MREIKFRAWDKARKIMGEVINIQFMNMVIPQVMFVIINETNPRPLQMPEEALLIQFTGLHDRNGKEIYEGDVVRQKICSKDDPAHGYYGKDYTVKWCEQEAGFNLYELDGGKFQFGSVGWNSTVIGNIHESPELLK